MKTIVSKGEFAKRKNRAPSAVSNWIASGKISKAALIGEGNAAKIWVEQAEADLAGSLDPSQQLVQASPILPTSTAPQEGMPAGNEAPQTPAQQPLPRVASSERELDLARRAKADADKAEHDAEQARRRLLIDSGKYVLAEESTKLWGRELARLMGETETFLFSTLAREIATAHDLDWKALAVQIRESFRKFRAEVSDDARARREALPTEPTDVG